MILWRVAASLLGCLVLRAQPVVNPPLADILSFEASGSTDKPGGWGFQPRETVFLEDKIVHGGRHSARLERSATSSGPYSNLVSLIPVDFTGKTIEFRGFLKTDQVAGFAALALREEDEAGNVVEFASMEGHQPVAGTNEWSQRSVQLPLNPAASRISILVLLKGAGTAWADDLELLVDGKPVVEYRPLDRERDHEFDSGSRIATADLTGLQIENLVTLGKVWGFLKYYHPQIAAGKYQWDYALFRIIPVLLQAPDRATANAEIAAWVNRFGRVAKCDSCIALDTRSLQIYPNVDWISDGSLLGPILSARLRLIRDSRSVGSAPFFAAVESIPNSQIAGVSFEHELPYDNVQTPDPGFQLLALYRYWNAIQYWSPVRNVMHEDWDSVLADYIPKIAAARIQQPTGVS